MVYVSPLKALAVDIGFNLEAPLEEIAAVARELGLEPAPITLGIRSGDTRMGKCLAAESYVKVRVMLEALAT